jgi:RecJ-like exonuclease
MTKLMTGPEVRAYLGGISEKTLARYRLNRWTEGIHYFQRVQRYLYNQPMIEDWLLNQHDPRRHLEAQAIWLREKERQLKRK